MKKEKKKVSFSKAETRGKKLMRGNTLDVFFNKKKKKNFEEDEGAGKSKLRLLLDIKKTEILEQSASRRTETDNS